MQRSWSIGLIALFFCSDVAAISAAEPVPKYFVLHCTTFGKTEKDFADYVARKRKEKATDRGHGVISPAGTYLEMWPLSRRDVIATKTETCKTTRQRTFGTFINIEIGYACASGSKLRPTPAQYSTAADKYAEAYKAYGPLSIVSHREVDRGLRSGHGDPYNFDFNALYAEIAKRGIDLKTVKRISQERHDLPTGSKYSHFAEPQLGGPLVLEKDRPDECVR